MHWASIYSVIIICQSDTGVSRKGKKITKTNLYLQWIYSQWCGGEAREDPIVNIKLQ